MSEVSGILLLTFSTFSNNVLRDSISYSIANPLLLLFVSGGALWAFVWVQHKTRKDAPKDSNPIRKENGGQEWFLHRFQEMASQALASVLLCNEQGIFLLFGTSPCVNHNVSRLITPVWKNCVSLEHSFQWKTAFYHDFAWCLVFYVMYAQILKTCGIVFAHSTKGVPASAAYPFPQNEGFRMYPPEISMESMLRWLCLWGIQLLPTFQEHVLNIYSKLRNKLSQKTKPRHASQLWLLRNSWSNDQEYSTFLVAEKSLLLKEKQLVPITNQILIFTRAFWKLEQLFGSN